MKLSYQKNDLIATISGIQVSTPQHRLDSPAPPSGAISDGNRPASVVAAAVPRLNGKIFHQARSQAKDKDYR
ncbi:hypothetical protein IKG12_00890 [Candidatus Saccharibacteria bacterium]|nr:hypothetical protein [Candidatus Saccharibacteria bacterium]